MASSFEALEQLVENVFSKELAQHYEDGCQDSYLSRSFGDLDLSSHSSSSSSPIMDNDGDGGADDHGTTTRTTITEDDVTEDHFGVGKLELLESWKGLMRVLKEIQHQAQEEEEGEDGEHTIYTEYRHNLQQAFVDVDSVDVDNYRHLNTLVKLLQHTAEHHDCDPSTNCRFATLLEIALSYGPSWNEPSADLARLWVRLMERPPPANMGPMAFRRKAYRILVSLSWVPISKGLLEACSFFETKRRNYAQFYKQQQQSAAGIIAPPGVRAQLIDRIRHSSPLERHDGVNMVLDRLKDETGVCVAITSEEPGVGKTTLAALVASHPSILRAFKVLWLRLSLKDDNDNDNDDHDSDNVSCRSTISTASSAIDDDSRELTYERYTKYLNNLCQQAGLLNETAPPPDWPTCEKRFEEPALRKLREVHVMEAARSQMAELLRDGLDQNVLLVLDDVTDDEQIRWFRFNELQSMIVVTTDSTLTGVDWSVPLDPVMTEDEATDLFLTEANLSLPSHALAAGTVEVRDVVRKCEYQPLTIRTVARWYQMKKVTAGRVEGLQEIVAELNSLTTTTSASQSKQTKITTGGDDNDDEEIDDEEDDDDDGDGDETPSLLFDVLTLMMGPDRLDGKGTSVLFVLCFAAMVVIFPQRRVPLDVVIILWEQLMRVSPLAVDELNDNPSLDASKHAWLIAEGLLHMGVVSVTNDNDGRGRWIDVHHMLYRDFGLAMAKQLDLGDSFEKTRVAWHKAFVTAYFEQRIQNTSHSSDQNSWEYAVEKLPAHIFQANMLSMAETILADDSFFRTRVETMGWDRAVELHLQDCVQLQYCIEAELDSSQDILSVSAVFAKTAAIICTYAPSDADNNSKQNDRVAVALYRIGFALAEMGYFEEGMVQFEAAQDFNPQSQGPRCCILYAISWVYLASGEGELALRNIESCRSLIGENENANKHELYKEVMQLHADGLVEACDYAEASRMLNVIEESLLSEADENKIELGTVHYRKGRLYHAMGDLENAEVAFKESIRWKEDIDECSHSLAVVFSNLADVELELQNQAAARAHFDCALRMLGRLDCDPSHISYLLMSGKSCLLKNDLIGGFASLEEAVESIEVAPLLLMDQSAYDLRCVAKSYKFHGNLNRAIGVLKKSLLLTRNREFSIERAWGLFELGHCLLAQGMVNQGVGCMEQSVQIQISKLGESANVLNTLKTIGEVHLSLGELDEALKAYMRILEVTNRIAPNDTERIASMTFAIGQVYEAKKSKLRAMSFYMNTIEILKNDGEAPDHLDVSRAMQRMGDIQAATSDLPRALNYYKEALRIRRMHFQDQLEAETHYSMGVVHRRLGDYQAAQQSLTAALALRNKASDSRATSATLLELGNISRLQGDPTSALPLYTEALQVLLENNGNGNNDELCGDLYLALGHSRLALGERGVAVKYYEQARDVRQKVFGADDMRTANVARSLGVANFLLGRQDNAMLLLTEFVRACETHSAEEEDIVDTPDYEDDKKEDRGNGDILDQLTVRENLDSTQTLDFVLAVVMLGDLHCARDNTEQAVRGWSLANRICAKRNTYFEERVPELANLIYRRLEEEEACISGGKVMLNDDEREILQRIAFVDD